MKFVQQTEISSPPDRVWAILIDVERWPEWTPRVTSLELLTPGPLAVGSRAFIRQPKLRPAEWRVTEIDAKSRSFTWAMKAPGLQVAGGHRVDVIGTGSRLTLQLDFTGLLGPFVARLYGDLNRQYLATEAASLRRRCEEAV